MPEFLRLLPPDEARARLLSQLPNPDQPSESILTALSLGRVAAADIRASHALPEFPRSTVDGYAVQARDTFGAADSLPAYLTLIGEVGMGEGAQLALSRGECALIHTGGMLPEGADAVVMLEYTQVARRTGQQTGDEIEVLRAAADGENVIQVGEDVKAGEIILPRGRRMRPPEIGGLMALGITSLQVAGKPRIGLISSGDEVIEPDRPTRPGQVRDVNSYTLAALVGKAGGEARLYGIVPDLKDELRAIAAQALAECDAVIISAGSSASTRDMTAEVIDSLGKPGVLVHGVNTRPGKPTILGVCDAKAVIGLPGNPVSALVNGYLFVIPVIQKLLGLPLDAPRPVLAARLTVNLPSQAGREDWWPVRLILRAVEANASDEQVRLVRYHAEPVFGKSNLIFTLAAADGLVRIPPAVTGLSAGETVEVFLLE